MCMRVTRRVKGDDTARFFRRIANVYLKSDFFFKFFKCQMKAKRGFYVKPQSFLGNFRSHI